MCTTCRGFFILTLIVSTFLAGRANAVILADHSTRNKSAPTGSLANSGWQWQGSWDGFTGTPIAKNYFIAASHIGGSVGDKIVVGSKSFTTTAMFDDPNSDLRIWKVSGSFSSFAPLYTSSSEVGKTAMIFGKGSQRGAAVTVDGSTHGYLWGPQDGRLSWGENKIKTIINGGSGIGDVVSFSFDRSGHGDHVTNEGTVSNGDSSGAVFINSSGKWRLAGINYSTDSPYSLTSGGATFSASLFDQGGVYYNGMHITDGSTDVAAKSYSTRISSNVSWINSVINSTSSAAKPQLLASALVPEPGSAMLLMLSAATLLSRKRNR